jgi:aspartyl-tRNA(Asn)/glutamyl-tRNA(Gln) amidotransferase subunit C
LVGGRYSSNEQEIGQARVYHCAPFKPHIGVFMSLSKQDIDHIARLARLDVPEHEKHDYVQKLSQIMELVEQLGAVDTAGVVPMAHPLDMVQRLRADVVTEINQRDYLQQNARDTENGLYTVPKVIE